MFASAEVKSVLLLIKNKKLLFFIEVGGILPVEKTKALQGSIIFAGDSI